MKDQLVRFCVDAGVGFVIVAVSAAARRDARPFTAMAITCAFVLAWLAQVVVQYGPHLPMATSAAVLALVPVAWGDLFMRRVEPASLVYATIIATWARWRDLDPGTGVFAAIVVILVVGLAALVLMRAKRLDAFGAGDVAGLPVIAYGFGLSIGVAALILGTLALLVRRAPGALLAAVIIAAILVAPLASVLRWPWLS